MVKKSGKAKSGKRTQRKQGQRGVIGNMLGGLGQQLGGVADNLVGGLIGGRSTATAAPAAFAGRNTARQFNESRQRGTEELGTLTVSGGTKAGTVLYQALVSPGSIGKRLQTTSGLWARYRFEKVRFMIRSSNPTTSSGNYTIGVDPDPVTYYADGPELPSRLMALTNATQANLWADAMVDAPVKRNGDFFYTGLNAITASEAEIRQFADGQIIVATTTDLPAEQETCQLTLAVEWEVVFKQPNTAQDVSSGIALLLLGNNNPYKVAEAGTFTCNDAVYPPGRLEGTYPLSTPVPVKFPTEAANFVTVTSVAVKLNGDVTASYVSTKTSSEYACNIVAPVLISISAQEIGLSRTGLGVMVDRSKREEWAVASRAAVQQKVLDNRVAKLIVERKALAKAIAATKDLDLKEKE